MTITIGLIATVIIGGILWAQDSAEGKCSQTLYAPVGGHYEVEGCL